MLYEMEVQLDLPHPTEYTAPAIVRIAYGYVPGLQFDGPVADLWFYKATLVNNDLHLADIDLDEHAREFLYSTQGSMLAAANAEGKL